MHLESGTIKTLGLIGVFLASVFVWVVAILLLLETTRQLLDVLRYVVELAQLS